MAEVNSILSHLNPKQQEAVTFWGSPLLVLAGAGSGKTKVLTHKAAWLIQEKGFAPHQILLLTFTNKAAGEMKERIETLLTRSLNNSTHTLPWSGTFHSFCAQVLRRSGERIGLSKNFVIFDENDQQDLVKEVVESLGLRKNIKPQAARHTISQAKNELISALEYANYARGDYQTNVVKIYLAYQKLLKENDALDFDDLLVETVKLFKNDLETLNKYRNTFQYVLVDEWQDTNKAQYEIVKLLASRDRNLTVVGDAAQCLLPGTQIHTLDGFKNIENIKVNDQVVTAAGRGKIHTQPVLRIKTSNFIGKVYSVKTKSGKMLQATPNHILFARLNKNTDNYYVYLMSRRDKGYRIGIAKGSRIPEKNRKEIGLLVRSNQENADKMWVLKVCKNRAEANFWEQWFAIEYGIPSMVFSTNGRSMLISQEQINKLYKSIDTKHRAERLFKELDLFEEYPHHRPKGIQSKIAPDRQVIYFTLFADKRPSLKSPWCGHRVHINTSNIYLKERLQKFKQYIRPGKRQTWRIENIFWDYEKALSLAEDIANTGQLQIINHSAFITDNRKFLFTPVSHLRETMEIGIFKKGQIITDEVVSIETEDYSGKVYDFDVKSLHNYVANGVVVHNSIYAWRGADYRNINYLQRDFPRLSVINLEQNYRSTQNILDAAFGVISQNKNHPILKLWTQNNKGERIKLYQARNELDEASYIVNEIQNLGTPLNEIAVLYRTNAQSRVLEEALLHAGIPYVLYGGIRFYERREIKDVLAYLRIIANPKDSVSLKRAEKIGKGRLLKLQEFTGENKQAGEKHNTLEILDLVLEKTRYLELFDEKDEEDLVRLENIKELRSVATEFPNLHEFLSQVALVESSQNSRGRTTTTYALQPTTSAAVTLMTAHAAKGLEFRVVFIVGLEEGLFPHSRSLMNQEELEEERRLAYVGITRAKEKLYLTFASRRLIFGSRSNNPPSRFLSEIPDKLIEGVFPKQSFNPFEFNDFGKDVDW